MKYFKISYEHDAKIVGIADQIQTFDKFGPSPYLQLPQDGPIDFKVEFPSFQMERKAKRTDFVCNVPISGTFMTISPKAFEVFKGLDIDYYQAYPIEVEHKGEVYPYIAFYLAYRRQGEFIDWKNSEFGIADRKNGYLGHGNWVYLENPQFSNWEEYNDTFQSFIKKPHMVLRCIKLAYTDNIAFDLFRVRGPIVGYYCSGKFKQTVEREGLTGFRFEEIVNNEPLAPSLPIEN